MCVHNEGLNLEPCIKHLYVDKFVIYDDESTDGSTSDIKRLIK